MKKQRCVTCGLEKPHGAWDSGDDRVSCSEIRSMQSNALLEPGCIARSTLPAGNTAYSNTLLGPFLEDTCIRQSRSLS